MSTMTEEEQQLCMIRGAIVGLPEEDQAKIKMMADRFREIIAADKGHGITALALVGAELSVIT